MVFFPICNNNGNSKDNEKIKSLVDSHKSSGRNKAKHYIRHSFQGSLLMVSLSFCNSFLYVKILWVSFLNQCNTDIVQKAMVFLLRRMLYYVLLYCSIATTVLLHTGVILLITTTIALVIFPSVPEFLDRFTNILF